MTKPSPSPAPSARSLLDPRPVLPCEPRSNTAEEAARMRFLASMTELLPEGEPK